MYPASYLAMAIATLFVAGLGVSAALDVSSARADVKVRSYDRGSKTEKDIGQGNKPGTRSQGRSVGTKKRRKGAPGSADLPPPQDDFENGEILMANPPQRLKRDLEKLGMEVIEQVDLKSLEFSYMRIRTPKKMPVRKALGMLKSRYPTATVDANHRYELSAAMSAGRVFPRRAVGWGPATSNCGAGLRIGLIDGAVDTDNPIIKGQKITYRSFHDRRRNPAPTGHGTAIAAMFVGKIQRNGWSGLVPGAELYAASMFEVDRRDQTVGTSTGLLRAMDWLFEQNVHVINLSIAGGDNEILRKAIEIARKKRIVLVSAVGNWGYRGEPAYPAAYPEVISVTAVEGQRHREYKAANQGAYIDFAAPGTSMWIPVNRTSKAYSGTSFAVPYVSVIVADQIANQEGSSDPHVLRKVIRSSVIDLGQRGKDNIFGYGLIRGGPQCVRAPQAMQHDQ